MEIFLLLTLTFLAVFVFVALMSFLFAPITLRELYHKGNLSFLDIYFWNWIYKAKIQELLDNNIISKEHALDIEHYDLAHAFGDHKMPSDALKTLYIEGYISIEEYRIIKNARSTPEPSSFSNHSALALFKAKTVSFKHMFQKNMLAIASLFEIAPIKDLIINDQDLYNTVLDFSSTDIIKITKFLNDYPKLQTLLCERHINLVQLKSMDQLEIEILNLGSTANLVKDKKITLGNVKEIAHDQELVKELKNLENIKLMSLFREQLLPCDSNQTRGRRNSFS